MKKKSNDMNAYFLIIIWMKLNDTLRFMLPSRVMIWKAVNEMTKNKTKQNKTKQKKKQKNKQKTNKQTNNKQTKQPKQTKQKQNKTKNKKKKNQTKQNKTKQNKTKQNKTKQKQKQKQNETKHNFGCHIFFKEIHTNESCRCILSNYLSCGYYDYYLHNNNWTGALIMLTTHFPCIFNVV